MDKRHLITITVLVSALAFNPITAKMEHVNVSKNTNQQQTNYLSSTIASYLYKRGLDKDAAYELSQNFVDEHDDTLEGMINSLINTYKNVSHDEIFTYLSTAVLYRQKVDLSSYDHLVSMISKIKGKVLTEYELDKLNDISKFNKMVFV
jgi:hypothetical protein